MSAKLQKPRVSLNQIREHSSIPSLHNKKRQELINAFLPEWYKDPFGIDVTRAKQACSTFCSGNRKSPKSLANVDTLKALSQKIREDSTFIDEALRRSRQWVTGTPHIQKDSSVFTKLIPALRSYGSDLSNKEAIDSEFDKLEKTLWALRAENTQDSLTYALFLLVLVGVLQEQITNLPELYQERNCISQLQDALPSYCNIKELPMEETRNSLNDHGTAHQKFLFPSQDGYDFLNEVVQHFSEGEIASIDMAFHGGDNWLRDSKMNYLLVTIMERNIPLRIIVNDEPSLKDMIPHMKQEHLSYVGFDWAIQNWKTFASQFPGKMSVRVSTIPLLHRVYLVRKQDGTGIANVSCYVYGKGSPNHSFRLNIEEHDSGFSVFQDEFDYLWEQSRE